MVESSVLFFCFYQATNGTEASSARHSVTTESQVQKQQQDDKDSFQQAQRQFNSLPRWDIVPAVLSVRPVCLSAPVLCPSLRSLWLITFFLPFPDLFSWLFRFPSIFSPLVFVPVFFFLSLLILQRISRALLKVNCHKASFFTSSADVWIIPHKLSESNRLRTLLRIIWQILNFIKSLSTLGKWFLCQRHQPLRRSP